MSPGSSFSSFPEEIQNNYQNDHQIQQTWESSKIGHFDEESWLMIFHHLNDPNLANVAAVCKTFETLARKVFKKRHVYNGRCYIWIPIDRVGWEPILCRFRNIITGVHLNGPTSSNGKFALKLIEKCLSESLRSLTVYLPPNVFEKMKFRTKFHNLEHLHLIGVNEINKWNLFTKLNQWCPNLKELTLLSCVVTDKDFFCQTLPSLEVVKFHDVIGINSNYLRRFFAENNRLKDVSLEGAEWYDKIMSWLLLVNELLINIETMSCTTNTLDTLPRFPNNFNNLKSLSFLMGGGLRTYHGTYTNDLLRITKYMPKIERMRVVNCSKNSMTNEDLLELIDQSSFTLKELFFSSCAANQTLIFGYDLHRQIYGIRNKSDICIEFHFGDQWDRSKKVQIFKITKEGIWENKEPIALAPRLPNS